MEDIKPLDRMHRLRFLTDFVSLQPADQASTAERWASLGRRVILPQRASDGEDRCAVLLAPLPYRTRHTLNGHRRCHTSMHVVLTLEKCWRLVRPGSPRIMSHTASWHDPDVWQPPPRTPPQPRSGAQRGTSDDGGSTDGGGGGGTAHRPRRHSCMPDAGAARALNPLFLSSSL